jgi:pimeloyl-ACP methyl ester carboxylesterase
MNTSLVRFLSRLFPGPMTRFAYRQLTRPQVRKLRSHEQEVLDQAERERIPFGRFFIQLYHWPGGPQAVLLIHGWEGQAGNFSDLIHHLRAQGYTVRAFDGPGHGFSSKGGTSLFAFSDLVAELITRFKVRKLVSHSFGGVATVYALARHPELLIDRYALLTTPDTFRERLEAVAQQVGINEVVKQRLIRRMEQETGVSVDKLSVSAYAPQTRVKKALILHDAADGVIPLAQSQRVAANWPVCELETITGTGHFRLLRTPAVIERVGAFLGE